MNEIDISVIVTTKNEEEHIGDCLLTIKRQNYLQNKIEIIVVDNNSHDRTKKIASRFTPLVYDWGPERSAQRNFGIEKARGKYLLYLDADMILSRNVIAECFDKSEEEKLVALYIPEKIIGRGVWIKVRKFERGFYNETCIDAVRFIRRQSAREINGFDEDLNGPEDWDFDRRINTIGKVGIINACLFHNEVRFNISEYLRKKIYYLNGFPRYIEKWGRSDEIIRKQFGAYYRLLVVFIENGKWKKLIHHPLLTTGMYILRIRVGMSWLIRKK